MSTPRFVSYYRVSTDKQGRSGLGLEAQRAAVEARMISARTKAALAAAKARGVRLGNPNLLAGSPAQARAANAMKIERAQVWAANVMPFIEQARYAGATTLQQLADALAARACSNTWRGTGRPTATIGSTNRLDHIILVLRPILHVIAASRLKDTK